MDDYRREQTIQAAKKWRNTVRRGDCSDWYAAQEVAGSVTYPFATAAEYSAVVVLALKHVR